MGRNALATIVTLVWAAPAAADVSALEKVGVRDGFRGAATATIRSTVQSGGESTAASGRVSLLLSATDAELDEGRVRGEELNLAFFEVPQQVLAGDLAEKGQTGVLGFSLGGGEPQYLRYDARANRLEGELRGRVSAAYMPALRQEPTGDAPGDVFETPSQPATVSVRMALDGPLSGAADAKRLSGELSLTLEAEARRYPDFTLRALSLKVEVPARFELEIGSIRLFEFGRRLCVQPVRIERCWLFFWKRRTGEGLAFGQPGANTEWAKADLVFDYRDWKTVRDGSHWVVSGSAEEAELRDEVDDDDCIEVFFTNDFDPEDDHGGGATWSAGLSESKIITSDANARYGIDLTHLAHELGHVVNLHHPGVTGTSLVPGSSGTLLCPSGFKRDNPAKNSQENEDNLSNPLLTFTLKPLSPGPDCDDSADCGACP